MDLRSIKPGMRSANLSGKRHPKTGELLEPIGFLRNGTAVWPVLGAAPDDTDEDDPTFIGGGGGDDEDDEDDENDEDEPKKPVKKSKTKSTKDEDEDDEDEEKLSRPERQAARYRVRLRERERENADLVARLKALEDKDKPDDEVVSRDLSEARSQVSALEETNRIMAAQLAFFKSNDISWQDPSDAFTLAEKSGLFDDVIDEDGTVDTRELRRGLRELAKRKPHLVKKVESTKGSAQGDTTDDEDETDDEPSSRRSASTMNRQRKGTKGKAPSREELARKFPVLNRL